MSLRIWVKEGYGLRNGTASFLEKIANFLSLEKTSERQGNNLCRTIVHARHGSPNWSADEGGVSDGVVILTELDVVTLRLTVGEIHRAGQMSGIVDQNAFQTEQVANESGEEDGAILTVAIGIEERFFSKEGTVIPPHLFVVFIDKGCLHPIEQTFGSFEL